MRGRASAEDALRTAKRFLFGGSETVEPFGPGHINDTFLVSGPGGRFVLQRVNPDVFPDLDAQMENISRVLEHLRRKEPDPRRVLRLVETAHGHPFLREGGALWRAYVFVDGGCVRGELDIPSAREAGAAFGRFQRQLADLPAPRLAETLKGFHDTQNRLGELEEARRSDPLGRAAEVQAELAFAGGHAELAFTLTGPASRGELPERVVHNDAKADNVLFDRETGEALCVIDLDTVMPGLSLHDFGDLVRSVVSTAREDDAGGGRLRLDVFKALAEGYLANAGDMLTPREIALLPYSAKVIAFELGTRFLADYILGDGYFKTERPRQNLDRCRAQFQLVESLIAAEPDLVSITASL